MTKAEATQALPVTQDDIDVEKEIYRSMEHGTGRPGEIAARHRLAHSPSPLADVRERAREAYLALYIDDADEVRAGKRDWNGFIKGYEAALSSQPVAAGEEASALVKAGEMIACLYCGSATDRHVAAIQVNYRSPRRHGLHDMFRVECPCGTIGKCRPDEASAIASWNEPWQAFNVSVASLRAALQAAPSPSPEVEAMVERLRAIMEKAGRPHLSVPGEPAWTIEKDEIDGAEKWLSNWRSYLPDLLTRLSPRDGRTWEDGIDDHDLRAGRQS